MDVVTAEANAEIAERLEEGLMASSRRLEEKRSALKQLKELNDAAINAHRATAACQADAEKSPCLEYAPALLPSNQGRHIDLGNDAEPYRRQLQELQAELEREEAAHAEAAKSIEQMPTASDWRAKQKAAAVRVADYWERHFR